MRVRAPTGETESLNGLLDTMTNVIGVLILMLLASFLTVRQVARTIEKKSALFARTKGEQMTDVRTEAARLEQSIAALRVEAANLDMATRTGEEGTLLTDAKARLSESNTVTGELLRFDPDVVLANLREAQKQLAALQEAVALQEAILENTRRTSVNRVAGVAPKPKTRIATVPDPVYPPTDAQGVTLLCRYGRVIPYDRQQMDALLKEGYAAAAGPGYAESLSPVELYRSIESYFDSNPIGQDGFRWRVRAEYDANDTTGKAFLQLRASIEWTDSGLGETLERIEEKSSAYQRYLQSLSVKANYLKFLVWSDSFAEYAVAREVADTYGFSSGWLPQLGDGVEVVLARTALKTQSPLEVPHIVQQSRNRSAGVPSGVGVVGGGLQIGVPSFGGGAGSGVGSVGFGGGGRDQVD